MQIRNQWKRPRDWKVVAGAGTLAAIGLTGLALAKPADGSVPDSISLEEQAQITVTTVPAPLPVNGVVDLSFLQSDNDSPFDDQRGDRQGGGGGADASANSPNSPNSPDDSPARGGGSGGGGGGDDSPNSPASPASPDSPDDSPARGGGGGGGGGGDDSPNSPASPASPDSPDSPDSADSSQDS